MKFKPTHLLHYLNDVWIPVIVNRELNYAITSEGNIFYLHESDKLKPVTDFKLHAELMKIKEIVLKLQTPGRGSIYQDEKMLRDFIDDEVARRNKELTDKLKTAHDEIAALTKINHQLREKVKK